MIKNLKINYSHLAIPKFNIGGTIMKTTTPGAPKNNDAPTSKFFNKDFYNNNWDFDENNEFN